MSSPRHFSPTHREKRISADPAGGVMLYREGAKPLSARIHRSNMNICVKGIQCLFQGVTGEKGYYPLKKNVYPPKNCMTLLNELSADCELFCASRFIIK